MPTFVLSASLIVVAYPPVSLSGDLLRRLRAGSERVRLLRGCT